MPKAAELPASLKPLARRQAFGVRHAHFGQDAESLIAKMKVTLGQNAKPFWSRFGRRELQSVSVTGVMAALVWFGWYVLSWYQQDHTPIITVGPPSKDTPSVTVGDPAKDLPVVTLGDPAKDVSKAPSVTVGDPLKDDLVGGEANKAEQERQAAIKAEQERPARAASEQKREAEQVEQQRQLFTIQMGTRAANTVSFSDMFYRQSFEECQQKCTQDPRCNVFTYNKRAGTCFIFPRATLERNADFDSGVRN